MVNKNHKIKDIAKELNVRYFSKMSVVCDESRNICFGVTPEGYKSFFDYGHWTLEGAAFFGKRIQQLKWLPKIFNLKG